MLTAVRWRDWEGHELEHCVCREDVGGMILEGVVAGTRHGTYGGYYLVRTDPGYRTREVRVRYFAGPCLHVESDGDVDWRDLIGNRSLPALEGCVDVDIGITPATNSLPIKRLKLKAQE